LRRIVCRRCARKPSTHGPDLTRRGADYGVLDGVCLLVYANKLDMESHHPLDVNEIASHLQFQNQDNKILQERLWHIQSCSAETGDGLRDVRPAALSSPAAAKTCHGHPVTSFAQ
jgi:prephenate dehydratase